MLGLFYNNLELQCYFIHESIEKNKKDELIGILSECWREDAIKKIYLEMFKKDLLENIKNDKCIDEDIKIYLSFLLSSYFLPKIKNIKMSEKIAEQLFV